MGRRQRGARGVAPRQGLPAGPRLGFERLLSLKERGLSATCVAPVPRLALARSSWLGRATRNEHHHSRARVARRETSTLRGRETVRPAERSEHAIDAAEVARRRSSPPRHSRRARPRGESKGWWQGTPRRSLEGASRTREAPPGPRQAHVLGFLSAGPTTRPRRRLLLM